MREITKQLACDLIAYSELDGHSIKLRATKTRSGTCQGCDSLRVATKPSRLEYAGLRGRELGWCALARSLYGLKHFEASNAQKHL